jgi:hypothetical protein
MLMAWFSVALLVWGLIPGLTFVGCLRFLTSRSRSQAVGKTRAGVNVEFICAAGMPGHLRLRYTDRSGACQRE